MQFDEQPEHYPLPAAKPDFGKQLERMAFYRKLGIRVSPYARVMAPGFRFDEKDSTAGP